jgi:D-glucosaminate PTS system EIIB component
MISLIRIDDRLIHGQVMAVWVRALRITNILVGDDATAVDAFTRQIMQLAMPTYIKLVIASMDEAVVQLMTAQSDPTRTLVLLKDVASAIHLHRGYPYKELNVGGIGMAPGRKLVWKSVAISPVEIDQLKILHDSGIDVYFQMIPNEERRSIAMING